MNSFYNKFEKLPQEIKQAVASHEALEVLDEIEDKYSINLMEVVFGVATKDIKLANLGNFFREEYDMEVEEAENLTEDLKEKIFKPILGYLEGEEIGDDEKNEKIIKEDEKIENEEKKEIEKMREKTENFKPLPIEELINEIAEKSNLFFEDEVLKKRFRNIISVRLKDVRDRIETKEILMRPKKVGGLELTEEEAEKVVKIIEQEFKNLDEKSKKEIKLPKFEIPRPVKATVFKPVKTVEAVKSDEPSLPAKQKIEIKKEIQTKENVKPSVAQTKEARKVPFKNKEDDSAKEDNISIPVKFASSRIPLSGKPLLEDIKAPPPKVIGPLEELKYFSLDEFRKLGDEPREAVSKIKQKIEFLEKDSFAKKAQGIKNWRQSEVYKLYLEIGRKSIEKNKTTSQVIQDRTAQGKQSLNEKEFEAIVDLNKSLRF